MLRLHRPLCPFRGFLWWISSPLHRIMRLLCELLPSAACGRFCGRGFLLFFLLLCHDWRVVFWDPRGGPFSLLFLLYGVPPYRFRFLMGCSLWHGAERRVLHSWGLPFPLLGLDGQCCWWCRQHIPHRPRCGFTKRRRKARRRVGVLGLRLKRVVKREGKWVFVGHQQHATGTDKKQAITRVL